MKKRLLIIFCFAIFDLSAGLETPPQTAKGTAAEPKATFEEKPSKPEPVAASSGVEGAGEESVQSTQIAQRENRDRARAPQSSSDPTGDDQRQRPAKQAVEGEQGKSDAAKEPSEKSAGVAEPISDPTIDPVEETSLLAKGEKTAHAKGAAPRKGVLHRLKHWLGWK